jgi:hypothetical protein
MEAEREAPAFQRRASPSDVPLTEQLLARGDSHLSFNSARARWNWCEQEWNLPLFAEFAR